MARPSVDEGFRFWRDEVAALGRPEKDVLYIPAIALIGVYATFAADPETLTSYHWRQAVLGNDDAMEGFRRSLPDFHRDRLDDTFELSVEYLTPEEHAAQQLLCAHESLLDGMPEGTVVVPENEQFLAQALGHARHDHGVMLDPLRVIDGGVQALRNNYPQTAVFVAENS